jgi:hypothetical protein
MMQRQTLDFNVSAVQEETIVFCEFDGTYPEGYFKFVHKFTGNDFFSRVNTETGGIQIGAFDAPKVNIFKPKRNSETLFFPGIDEPGIKCFRYFYPFGIQYLDI